jgi:hypothetical protein
MGWATLAAWRSASRWTSWSPRPGRRGGGPQRRSSLTGAALPCHGLVEREPAVLRSAVDAYAQRPRPLELALTAEDPGTGFARRGDAAAAAPLLHQALAAYERLDAARGAARVEATLRELGIRRGRRGARRRPQVGWDSLTPTEHRVVDLVVEGLSNPRSASACSSRAARCRPTSPTCSPSWGSPPAPSWPPRRCGTATHPGAPRAGQPPPGTESASWRMSRTRPRGRLGARTWRPNRGGTAMSSPA